MTDPVDNRKIEFRHVDVELGSAVVLRDVSLVVHEHEIVCLIGPSGCGKTTLLNILAGLIPHAQGEVLINGDAVKGPGSDRVMVFQDDAVFPWLSVRRNVEYGLQCQGATDETRTRRVTDLIRKVGLSGREDYFPRQLSGGMRKRVDLARALAVQPEVLLMDEPYAALDAMTKERLQVEFLRVHGERPTTVLFVTHDLEESLFLGDRVIAMGVNPGHIHSVMPVEFARPRTVELKRSGEFQSLRGKLAETLAPAEMIGVDR